MRPKSTLLVLSAVVGWLFCARVCETCGPFFLEAVFVRPHGPDRPMSSFARGRIGIVLPTWYRAYLVVAYRYLESKPLSDEEVKSLLDHWDVDRRIEPADRATEAIAGWITARKHYFPSASPERVEDFLASIVYDVPNCRKSAFKTAEATLNDRARRFGAASPELREWARGQDAVFSACTAGQASVPADVPSTAHPLLRADRAYQIAASNFYRGDYEDAVQRFQAIAQDSASPWHGIAPYLVARAMIREATLTAPPKQPYDAAALARAQSYLQRLISDPKERAIRQDVQSLFDLVEYHLHPSRRRSELAQELARGGNGVRFGQGLTDYTWLLDRLLDAEPEFPGVQMWTPEYTKLKEQWTQRRFTDLEAPRADDLTDWVMTMQSDVPAAKDHALAKWKSMHSVCWLVAALEKRNPGDASAEDLFSAAAEIPRDSPGYLSASYYRAKLARESGEYPLARQVLGEALSLRETLPASAVHLLQDEQMLAAADFGDFESHLWQQPVRLDSDWVLSDEDYACSDPECGVPFYGAAKPSAGAQLLPQFDPVAARVLNTQLPIAVLVRVLQSKSLPENLRRRMAPSVWARAALLDHPEFANVAAESAIAAQPGLRPYVATYNQAKTSEERRFAVVFTIMHFPGLRPFADGPYPRSTPFEKVDSYRDNWWCKDFGEITDHPNFFRSFYYQNVPAEVDLSGSAPAFLDGAEKLQAASERQQLHALGAAPTYLPQTVIDWATLHPDDPRVPEALHLAVRATRYGCGGEQPNRLSRRAYTMLRQNYPRSEWAKKTPFWFE